MSYLIDRAKAFAIDIHDGQVRDYTGEPYWHHLRNVADLVADVTTDEEAIAAAWLHDSVEDKRCTRGDLAQFGAAVRLYVHEVTKAASEEATLRRLYHAEPMAQTIKLADILDNCSTLRARDPVRARSYFLKKRTQVAALYRGNPTLWCMAKDILG